MILARPGEGEEDRRPVKWWPVHELSIAQALVRMLAEEAARHGTNRIVSVRLRLGRLSGIVGEALTFAFDVAAQGTVAEGARLHIEDAAGREMELVAMEIPA
jgi:hydrogenase nickel insertion protein HypA